MPGRSGKRGLTLSKHKHGKEVTANHTVAQKDNPHYKPNTANEPTAEEERSNNLKQLRKRGINIINKEDWREHNYVARLVVDLRKEISDIEQEVNENWPVKVDYIKKTLITFQTMLDDGANFPINYEREGETEVTDLAHFVVEMGKELSVVKRGEDWPVSMHHIKAALKILGVLEKIGEDEEKEAAEDKKKAEEKAAEDKKKAEEMKLMEYLTVLEENKAAEDKKKAEKAAAEDKKKAEKAAAEKKLDPLAVRKAEKKKIKRDKWKMAKKKKEAIKQQIEDTPESDGYVQSNVSPAAPLSRQNRIRDTPPEWFSNIEEEVQPMAESRTSSASSSGSSSFESVQEDEDTDQPAKKQRTQSVFT